MAKGKSKTATGPKKSGERAALNTDLFVLDDEGDDSLRRQLLSSTWDTPAAAHPRKGSGKPLKSEQILAMRSKVPARMSKAQPRSVMQREKLAHERREKIDPEVKKRLRSMVKRNNVEGRGLWDVSAQKDVSGQELSTAVKEAGSYDVWLANQAEQEEEEDESMDHIKEIVKAPKPKVCRSFDTFSFIRVIAHILPHYSS